MSNPQTVPSQSTGRPNVARHEDHTTETRPAFKTTEFMVYIAAVVAVVITALVVGDDVRGGGGDPFGAEQAIRYITFLTIGYMVARGLAKAGSWARHDDRR
ncbi:hypothetical protein ACIBCT_16220 [Streptosporangium sp. NPDC050855]|uniref:hypothetical protein n=1 Tax=Streptosporangium sp. NPDC050855 TaxID=3366194 RepID=UPI00379F36C5